MEPIKIVDEKVAGKPQRRRWDPGKLQKQTRSPAQSGNHQRPNQFKEIKVHEERQHIDRAYSSAVVNRYPSGVDRLPFCSEPATGNGRVSGAAPDCFLDDRQTCT